MSDIKENPEVIELLDKAIEAGSTMLARTREAAEEAAKELDFEKKCNEAVKEVRDRYKAQLDRDTNVYSIFGDMLTLHYAADMRISIERKVDGKITDVHMEAGDAVGLIKHEVRKAAKEVRDGLGIGRASGGGRKPQTPTKAPVQSVYASAKSALENLLKSDAGVQALRELLKANGYQLRKVGK